MNYQFHLIVESELEEIVAELKTNSIEGLEGEIRKAEKAIKDYEDKKEAEAQWEYDRQKEEGLI